MFINDLINGAFELSGGFLLFLNVQRILRDKKVLGVHWASTAFFTSWGLWNLWYYPSLDQWISFCGGLGLVIMNSWWLWLMFYYKHIKKD